MVQSVKSHLRLKGGDSNFSFSEEWLKDWEDTHTTLTLSTDSDLLVEAPLLLPFAGLSSSSVHDGFCAEPGEGPHV